MHDHANRQADGIGQNVSLAAFDHLFSGIATRPCKRRELTTAVARLR